MPDYLLRAALAASLIAVMSGPMGCFVVWRGLAYFGATIAHAALLGVSLGLLLQIGDVVGLVVVAMATAIALAWSEKRKSLSSDTLLGIIAHGSLALGLVLASIADPVRLDIMGYLFGDVLAVSWTDLAWIAGVGVFAMGLLARIWSALLAATAAEEMAQAEGINVRTAQSIYFFLLATLVACAAKIVGLLLVTALLIIPAATARPLARAPESMAVVAMGLGVMAAGLGLAASAQWDFPTGPAIAASSFLIFMASAICRTITALFRKPAPDV